MIDPLLKRVADEVAQEWGLGLESPFAAQHSYVAAADHNAVVKVQSMGDDESLHEANALALWNGDGAVRLIRSDSERRALLLERAVPGNDISELPEEVAISIAVDVARRLWRATGEPFRWIGDHVPTWLEDAALEPSPAQALIPVALDLFRSLNPGRSTLVHGDLHHHNILDAGEGRYVAIDPKPMLGDPEFDVPPMLWNPIGPEMTPERTEFRLNSFASHGLDQWRMRAWSIIRGAYLSVDESEADVLRSLI